MISGNVKIPFYYLCDVLKIKFKFEYRCYYTHQTRKSRTTCSASRPSWAREPTELCTADAMKRQVYANSALAID